MALKYIHAYVSVVLLRLMHSYIQSHLLVRAEEVMYVSGKINIISAPTAYYLIHMLSSLTIDLLLLLRML